MQKINLKDIHIGKLIQENVMENDIQISRMCKFLKCSDDQIEKMYHSKSLDVEILMRWSKLLKYDFFRIYSQHLILYAPKLNANAQKKNNIPQFRKNIYTKELIDFILEEIKQGNKTKIDIINEYGIPKTTLYKWIQKYTQTDEIMI